MPEGDQGGHYHHEAGDSGKIEGQVEQAAFRRLCQDENRQDGKDLAQAVDEGGESGLLVRVQQRREGVRHQIDAEEHAEDGEYLPQFGPESPVHLEQGRPVQETVDGKEDQQQEADDGSDGEIGGRKIFPGQFQSALGLRLGKLVPETVGEPEVEEGDPADDGGYGQPYSISGRIQVVDRHWNDEQGAKDAHALSCQRDQDVDRGLSGPFVLTLRQQSFFERHIQDK